MQQKHDPEGLEAEYKKVSNMTHKEMMENNYTEQVLDTMETVTDHFQAVTKDEKDVMNHTKNYVLRERLAKDLDFTEDFRKRFLTQEYGDYEKYQKNAVKTNQDSTTYDNGDDKIWPNLQEFNYKLKTSDAKEFEKEDTQNWSEVIQNRNTMKHEF